MGQGTSCCGGGSSAPGQINLDDASGTKNFNKQFTQRDLLVIVKLQAWARGCIARKHVQQKHGFVARTMGSIG